MAKEYNLLTKRLLEMGYSADNYPDYVRLEGCWNKEDPIDNFHGGFTFQRQWIRERTYKTPCGLQCKGRSCHTGNMFYRGIEWTFENDMPTITCPYREKDCELKHKYLQVEDDSNVLRFMCNVHMSDEEYRYEGSVEEIRKMRDDEIEQKRIEFSLQHHGRVCYAQMHYDHDKQEWRMTYDPGICARNRCMRECGILGRQLDKKKGNVYYDLKITKSKNGHNGAADDSQMYTEVTKGKRVFERQVSMDICRNYVKLCSNELVQQIRLAHHSDLFFAEHYGRPFSLEVLNIRAEQRESRDLLQDLQDIQAGIQVTHASDQKRQLAEEKRERRRKAQEKKIAKLEKKILETGYDNLEENSLDRIHADKWLGRERIVELEEERQRMKAEEAEEPV